MKSITHQFSLMRVCGYSETGLATAHYASFVTLLLVGTIFWVNICQQLFQFTTVCVLMQEKKSIFFFTLIYLQVKNLLYLIVFILKTPSVTAFLFNYFLT